MLTGQKNWFIALPKFFQSKLRKPNLNTGQSKKKYFSIPKAWIIHSEFVNTKITWRQHGGAAGSRQHRSSSLHSSRAPNSILNSVYGLSGVSRVLLMSLCSPSGPLVSSNLTRSYCLEVDCPWRNRCHFVVLNPTWCCRDRLQKQGDTDRETYST